MAILCSSVLSTILLYKCGAVHHILLSSSLLLLLLSLHPAFTPRLLPHTQVPGSSAPDAYWPTRGTKGRSDFKDTVAKALMAAVTKAREEKAAGEQMLRRGPQGKSNASMTPGGRGKEQEEAAHFKKSAEALDASKLARVLERDLGTSEGDLDVAPERVRAARRWAKIRHAHVEAPKKKNDLMRGFDEFKDTGMQEWPAFVVKVRLEGY